MNLKKMILKVFSANFIQLIAGIIVGFVVPSILDIEQYASLKTYTLFLSYIGLLHFGFVDGLYLKYGGKKYEEIDKSELMGEHVFLIICEVIVSLLLCTVGILSKHVVVVLFGLSIIPYMIASFFKYLYQSIGEFNKYSKIMYIYSITYLVLNVVLAFIFKSNNYILYCVITIISNILSAIYFEIMFITKTRTKIIFNFKNFGRILKSGFILMLGNLAVTLILGIDKWFVKLNLTVNDFAYYSFAVSMLNIINTLVSAVSITFYNYLFKNSQEENLEKLKNVLLVFGAFSSTVYFVLSFIVNNYLQKYIPSLGIISITFAIFPYLTIISSLVNNLYKVNKKEKRYLKVVLGVLLLSFIYNLIGIIVFKNTTSIAGATLLTMVTWLVYSCLDIKLIKIKFIDYTFLTIVTSSFVLISHFYDSIIGMAFYFIIVAILTVLFYKNTVIAYFRKGIKNAK